MAAAEAANSGPGTNPAIRTAKQRVLRRKAQEARDHVCQLLPINKGIS